VGHGVRGSRGRAAETEGRLTSAPQTTSSAPPAFPPGAEDLRLPKPPGFIRSFFNRHPWLLDGLIAGAYAIPVGIASFVLFVLTVMGSTPWEDDPIRSSPIFAAASLYVTAAVSVGLLFRRHVPVITAIICAVALLVPIGPAPQADGLPMMFALYALAVYRTTRSAWIWTGIAVVASTGTSLLYTPTDLAGNIGNAVLSALVFVIATLVGITFGNRRRYIQALLDRAAQLARERDQRAQLAAAAERARIAREMHDIVAHSLTVIVALSDGAEASLDRSPETAREAVRQTGITARRALADVRRSLGVLTEAPGATDAALAPQPGLGELPELIASFRAAGLPVRYTVHGEPPADPVLQLTVFRVLQEALTNALRYAVQATAVDVVLAYDAAAVRIEVLDDGVDPARGAASVGSGRGIIGMRERVAVYGGRVETGPAGGSRGWRVRAVLPVAPGTTPVGAASPTSTSAPTPAPAPAPISTSAPAPTPVTTSEGDR